jgi:putative ABC transport system substrate-binding protein
MDRRRFILTAAAGAIMPSAARARDRAKVVGLVCNDRTDRRASMLHHAGRGLAEHGFVPGGNVSIVERWTAGRSDMLPRAIQEIASPIASSPADVLIVSGDRDALSAARRARLRIPLVYCVGIDPMLVGVEGHPFANGVDCLVTFSNAVMARPTFETAVELLPASAHFGVLVNPRNPDTELWTGQLSSAARGHRLSIVECIDEAGLETAFSALVRARVSGLIVASDGLFFAARHRLVALAARHAMPAMYAQREFAEAGGLATYGLNTAKAYRLAGAFAGQILHGENVARPTPPHNVELVINLGTARTLGLDLPESTLKRAVTIPA